MSDSAMKPISLPVLDVAREETEKGPTPEENQLYTMSKSAGWKVLMKYKDGVVKDLENVNKEAIASGASFEEIGKNALVINMAQDIITRFLNKVQDAADVCESNDK